MNLLETTSTKKLNNGITNGTPEGWTRCPLKKIALRITKGATPTSYGFMYQGEGIRFVKVENLNNGRIDHKSIKHFISEEANLNQRRSVLLIGDILFSIAGTIGRTCLVREEDLPANTNQALAIIRGTSDILLPYFLQLQLQSQISSRQASNQARGGSMNNISLEDVGNIEIWVPPLTEQKRIVAKLEGLLTRVNTTKGRLAKVSVILKRFRQAVLAAACSGRLTADWREKNPDLESAETLLENIQERRLQQANTHSQSQKIDEIYSYQEEGDSHSLPENWRYWALDKLCESFQYGTSKKSEPSGKVAVLRMGNIQDGEIDWNDLVYTSDDEEIKKYKLNPGDILFNRTNSPELVGKTAIYRGEHPAIFAGYLIKIHYFKELDSRYLNVCLNTTYAKHFCMKVKTDGVSQSNINAQKLGKFEVPFCPLEEQYEIVRRVEALFKLADVVEKRVAAATARAEKLTQAILAKAFRGELVPTEADLARRERRLYESASDLLARIKSERESKGASKLTPRNRNQQKARRTRPAQ